MEVEDDPKANGGEPGSSGNPKGEGDNGGNPNKDMPGYMAAVKADLREKYGEELKQFENINPIIEDYFNLKGKLQNAVILPKEGASEEELAQFREKMGIPSKPDEYELEKPPEAIGEQPEFDQWFKDVSHETGLTKEQAKGLYTKWNELQAKVIEEKQAAVAEVERQLRKELGSGYDEAMSNATAILKLGGDDLVSWLNETGAGNDPRFIKTFAKLGSLISEDSLSGSGGGDKGGAPKDTAEIFYPTKGE